MLTNRPNRDKDKLIPLRKFSVEDIYSPAYLSQLVQRGKLKAKQIGRNYYTCEKWFSEYLDQHAQDAKYAKYQEYLKKETQLFPRDCHDLRPRNDNRHTVHAMVRTRNNKWKQIAISMAVFLLFIIIGLGLYISYGQGRIAGVEEQYNQSADDAQTLPGLNSDN